MNTKLTLPKTNQVIVDFEQIKSTLNHYGVDFTRWSAHKKLTALSSQDEILEAYSHELHPYMKAHGFTTSDVINVSSQTPNISALRLKFLAEHTHSEDEVRFFVEGSGVFWFHFENGDIASLKCVSGDFLSVPKNIKHWFDIAPDYRVIAIRIFTNPEGWVANYTHSKIEQEYL